MRDWKDKEEILERIIYFYKRNGRLPEKKDLDWALNDYWPNSRQIASVFSNFQEALSQAWKKMMREKITVIK